MLSANVTNGSADSCATITARRLERFVVVGQGGVLQRRAIVPARFGVVGVWLVHGNSAVFLRRRDRGSEDAVVFPGIGDEEYFDQKG